MLYYAKTKELDDAVIAVFTTKEERDAWVNYSDPFSIGTGMTRDDSMFDQIACEIDSIESGVDKDNIYTWVNDQFDSNIKYLVASYQY